VPQQAPLVAVTSSTQNPLQIALLHWYDTGLTATFGVGSSPRGVAFDGANIWVVNNGSSNLTKLRASYGTVLGTFGVGSAPVRAAFDGANVWVTNNVDNTVSKL
jgi:DNA-binding beta-propeller fold protein YncE